MKTALIILSLIFLSGLTLLEENTRKIKSDYEKIHDDSVYIDGILKSEYQNVNPVSFYEIDVELFPLEKTIEAKERILWVNKTSNPTNEIHFHLYPNAFKNNKTEFMKGRSLPDESKSEIQFQYFSVNNKEYELIYFQPDTGNESDSTVAKVILPYNIYPEDTIEILIKYSMPVPRSISRSGHAGGRELYFFAQWFPKIGVFEKGEWVCSQFHPYTEFYSNFSEYAVRITVPKSFTVAASGFPEEEFVFLDEKKVYLFKQFGVHDFAWMASENILQENLFYFRKDGSHVEIKGYFQPENKKYIKRYLTAVHNTLEYLEENIGIYPYKTLSLIDFPKTASGGGMEYPTLVTVGVNHFSPIKSHSPELVTIHEVIHQYFYGLVANNEVIEAWLDEGFTSYLTTKILHLYYGEAKSYFRLFGFYPVSGILFYSYNEIPLIYTLSSYYYSEGSKRLPMYLENALLGSIADTSYKHINRTVNRVNSYNKPELMLLSLERYIGKEKMMEILKVYFNSFKYKHTVAQDFIDIVQFHTGGDINWFFDNFYRSSKKFDYTIKSVARTGSSNIYEVLAIRNGEAISKSDIAFYTENDTLYKEWDGKDRWKKFIFKTDDAVIGAEIDPYQKNMLDINYANNSYMVEKQYSGTMRLTIRWFFFIQNLLLIFGSIS